MRKIASFLIIIFFLALFSNFAFAAGCECYCMASDGKTPTWVGTDPNGTCSQPCPSPYTGYSYCGASQGQPYQGTSGAPVTLDNPLPDAGTPQVLIGKVISAALGLVGSLALAMFIFGGFMWMTAMGNADKVKKGRDTMIWAALGLVIIFTAYALITFVLTNVLGAK